MRLVGIFIAALIVYVPVPLIWRYETLAGFSTSDIRSFRTVFVEERSGTAGFPGSSHGDARF